MCSQLNLQREPGNVHNRDAIEAVSDLSVRISFKSAIRFSGINAPSRPML